MLVKDEEENNQSLLNLESSFKDITYGLTEQ